MTPDQKAMFEACMKFADYFAGRWDRRRTDEIRITIAIWTFEIGGIYFVKKPSLVPYWVAAAIVVVYGLMWLKRVWDANDAEIRQMIFYQEQANAVMRDAAYVPLTPPPYRRRGLFDPAFLGNWSMQFQLLSVAGLAVLFYWIPRPN